MPKDIDWLNVVRYFYISDEQLQQLSWGIAAALAKALQGEPAAGLSALKSYIGLPEGQEEGQFLALDFGGTNVRAARIRLTGRHSYLLEKKVSRPLKKEGVYNYLAKETTADELFAFLASLIAEVAEPGEAYALGHTFSFGITRDSLADGKLESWAKEMAVPGVQGRYVNALLKEALEQRGLDQIEPVALVNDTTALLLTAAYTSQAANIALVCGTGFNTCYYEPQLQMIINMETGNYQGLQQNDWDLAVDAASQQPGFHQLEKMVSGAYLAEVYRQVLCSYFEVHALPHFTTAQMDELLEIEDNQQLRIKMGKLWQVLLTPKETTFLRNVAAAIFARSAQISGAVVAGILHHLYGQGEVPPQLVALDGSVIGGVRGARFMLEDALQACHNEGSLNRARQVPVEAAQIQSGSLVGAAIAAAMAEKKQ